MKSRRITSLAVGLLLVTAVVGFGAQWVATGGPPFGGAVDIAVSGNLVFAADNNWKLYRSTDGGNLWIYSPPPPAQPISNPTAVVYTSGNNVANVGFWGSPGTKFSLDQGDNWNTPITPVTNTQVTCLAAAPSDPTRVYSGCNPSSTLPVVFRSTNAGAVWASASPGNMATITDLGVGPRHPDLVVATASSQKRGIWRTANGGPTGRRYIPPMTCTAWRSTL
jgi:hypothetical protein